MNNDNGFDLIFAVVFAMSPQLGVLGTKYQDLVIPFFLYEGETLPKLHLRSLQIRSEFLLLKDETGQINKLTDKHIM